MDILRLGGTEVANQLFKSVKKKSKLSVGSREDRAKQESKGQAERTKKKKKKENF